jgi:hypothetical protein
MQSVGRDWSFNRLFLSSLYSRPYRTVGIRQLRARLGQFLRRDSSSRHFVPREPSGPRPLAREIPPPTRAKPKARLVAGRGPLPLGPLDRGSRRQSASPDRRGSRGAVIANAWRGPGRLGSGPRRASSDGGNALPRQTVSSIGASSAYATLSPNSQQETANRSRDRPDTNREGS